MIANEFKKADEGVGGGCGFSVSKLFDVKGVINFSVSPIKYVIFTNETGDEGNSDWSQVTE